MQVVLLGVHVDGGRLQRAEDALGRRQRVGVAPLRLAKHDVAPREGTVLGGARPAVFGAPHRMGGHEAPAAGVHRDHLAQFGLDGAQIHYDLVPLHAVEGFYGHQGDRIDGGGQHHEVGLRDALFERHDAVGQPEPQRLGGVLPGTVCAEYFVRYAAVA